MLSPIDHPFEARDDEPLLLEGEVMSSDPLNGGKHVRPLDKNSPNDHGLQNGVSTKFEKPFKC
jgi:hypothetical protein